MKVKSVLLIAAVVTTLVMLAGAQEKFGVKIYPGAKEFPVAEQALANMGITAGCYRTGDSKEKVAAFYRQQPGLRQTSQTDVLFEFEGMGVKMEIDSPWVDTSNFSSQRDTLICIKNK